MPGLLQHRAGTRRVEDGVYDQAVRDADGEAPGAYCCAVRPGDADRSTALGRMTRFTSPGRIFQM